MPTRVEHRRATLRRLSDAAVELFEAEGLSATIDAIAERAGVSRRTVFRYVDGKEELAFIHPMLWLDVFEDALVAASGESLVDRLQIASAAIAAFIDDDPGPPRRALAVVGTNPGLARGYTRVFQSWIDRIAAEVEMGASGPVGAAGDHQRYSRFRARIVGAAMMGMVDAVTREWLFSPPDVRFADLYDEGFAMLEPLLS